MAQLKYKTRGNCNPQGLPRVYFCCHPLDFEIYFENISQEILGKQNCAIYFDTQPDKSLDTEQLLADLKQMQLLVMPVTSRLLNTPNRALDIEFHYALQEHIPVLPLLQEAGLENLFNIKCGNLQFLDKTAHDETAIRYEEKLDKFLSSILIGDELAAKIRAAFDAYVFLSYRKKDRRYAQELMHLIHKNDFCQDIAIWYDEFLTPGENFNDAISNALKKCKLFALAVTPNLVCETNYVMTTEYPMARNEGKTILPIEIVPTDKNELATKFIGIPPCTSAFNELELTGALTTSLRNIAMRENDKDPQHNFFIGLAYLTGIDVEVDREKAFHLIEHAAQMDLPEAIIKLVQMYRDGEGIARDYEKAIIWQKKLVELYKANDKANHTPENKLELIKALSDLGDYEADAFHLNSARETYDEVAMREFDFIVYDIFDCTHTSSKAISEEVSYYALKCKISCAKIAEKKDDLRQAYKDYSKCLETAAQYVKSTPSIQNRQQLAYIHFKLGIVSKKEKNYEEARTNFKQSLEIYQYLIEEANTFQARYGLIKCYEELGDLELTFCRPQKAQKYFLDGLDIGKKLILEDENPEIIALLAECYENSVRCIQSETDLLHAQTYLEEAIKLREQIVTTRGTIQSQCDLAMCYRYFAQLAITKEQYITAKEYLHKSFRFYEQLLEKTTEAVKIRKDMISICDFMIHVLTFETDIDEIEKYLKYKEDLWNQLINEKKTDKLTAQRSLALTHAELGLLCLCQNNNPLGKLHLIGSEALYESIYKETGSIQSCRDLANLYCSIANSYSDQSHENSQSYLRKELELRERLLIESDNSSAYDELIACHTNLFSYDKHNTLEYNVIAYYRTELSNITHLTLQTKELPDYWKTFDTYSILGLLEKKYGFQDIAHIFLKEAHDIGEMLINIENTPDNYAKFASICTYLGTTQNTDIGLIEKALKIWEELCEAHPEHHDYIEKRDKIKDMLREM